MRHFALVVAYDGTEFHGWQRQPRRRTVQGTLEDALRTLFETEVTIAGAGRTDAGVHARGQVASFRADTRLPARALTPRLGRLLPADLRVVSARETGPNFDARGSARARRYAYRLLREDDVLLGRFAWRPPVALDGDALERATEPLRGTHDFASFQSAGSPRPSTECTVLRAGWSAWEGGLRFDVIANRFLYRMVRTMVGSALRASREADPGAAMRRVLEARDRGAAGPSAPPEGLTLEAVDYPAEEA